MQYSTKCSMLGIADPTTSTVRTAVTDGKQVITLYFLIRIS